MRIRFLSSALLISVLTGLPIAVTSSAQSNSAVAQLPDSRRSEQKALATPAPEVRQKIAANYGKLPISFEANHGQTGSRVKFVARGSGYGLYLNGHEAVLALHAPQPKETHSGVNPLTQPHTLPSFKTDVVRMQLRNANPAAQPVGVDPLPGTANYFAGNDPSKWLTAIPTYSRAKFSGVYPGIDLVYYGNQSQLEYDFIVAPKADPNAIRLHFAGARKLALTNDGDLSISAKDGQIAFHKPVIYQEAGGQRQPVEGRFTLLADRSVGFSLGRYDRSRPLVIDPLLVYSTYLSGTYSDGSNAIAVDGSGNVYVAGTAASRDFPITPGAFQKTNYYSEGGDYDAFITKLNPAGTALLYSTYLGGFGYDNPASIAIDTQGNAYVAGIVNSRAFPVTKGAFQTVNNSPYGESPNGFITKLNPTGTGLVYSTYLGGSGSDGVSSIAVDAQGNAYVAGTASSQDFPVTPGAFQTTNKGAADNASNAFVTKLNPTGTGLVYSTYLGGSGEGLYYTGDGAAGIAIDGQGNAYVTGYAGSKNFPVTPGAFQTTNNEHILAIGTGFIAKFNPSGGSLLYSTFLGGSGGARPTGAGDMPSGIAVDETGNAYVTGITSSTDFPVTPGAFQTVNNNANEGTGFITKLNPAGMELVYSTYLGGSGFYPFGSDTPHAIALDDTGSVYVTGNTTSSDFPVTDALQGTNHLPSNASTVFPNTSPGTAFLTQLNPSGTELLFSSYLGGSTSDTGNGIALGNDGDVYIAGTTKSVDFPVTPGVFQAEYKAQLGSGFISKLNLKNPSSLTSTTTTLATSNNPQTAGVPLTLTTTVTGLDTDLTPTGNVIFSANGTPLGTAPLSFGAAVFQTSALTVGTHPVQASYVGGNNFRPSSAIQSQTIVFPQITFAPKAGQYTQDQVVVTLTPSAPNSTIYYTLDGSTPTAASHVYTGPIILNAASFKQYSPVITNTTIAAREVLSGGALSLVSQATYTIVPLTPTPYFYPGPGSYPVKGQMIYIYDVGEYDQPSPTIYYTTDGSTPTTQSPVYTGPITLTPGTEIIRAFAVSSSSTQRAPSLPISGTFTTPQ